jgi:Mycothiol maleylpyruvate isomerase N-terminal domain
MAELARSERARLLDYLRTRAAGLDAPRLRARVRSAAAEFEAALAGLTEADARRPAQAGEWTVAQVVDHVAQSTVRSAEELRHLRAGRRPPGPPIYEALLSGAAHRVPWTELVEGLREATVALDEALAAPAVRDGEASRAVTAPAVLVVNAEDGTGAPEIFTADLTWPEYALVLRLHFLEHRTHVRSLRAAHA